MNGMVVAPQPLAVEEGTLVLKSGGNAIDAAVTAAMVQGVVDALNCGIGGFGSMHVYLKEPEKELILDFTSTAGSRAQPDMWVEDIIGPARDGVGFLLRNDVNEIGYHSIGVPGTVAGLFEALTQYGTLSWADALAPAIRYAKHGYAVPYEQAQEWRVKYPPGRPDALTRFSHTPASAAIYTRDGQCFDAGDVLPNADLAHTLERLASEGPADFYHGGIASQIAEDLAEHAGLVTLGDLASFRTHTYVPLSGSYRGFTVASAPPPWGSMLLIEILNILEGYDLAGMGFNSPDYIRTLALAMKAGFSDRNRFEGDPDFIDVPIDWLTSKQHAEEWRQRIDSGRPFDVGFDRSQAGSNTTHLCVVDSAGNCVSLTHTLGYGSGVVTPGLGFIYNNVMVAFDPMPGGPNSIAAGKKRRTGGLPTMVLRDGQPYLILGAPGGTRIVSAVLQTILNVIDHGMPILNAVAAPRIDCQGEIIDIEGRIPHWVSRELQEKGYHIVRDTASYGVYPTTAARVHAILIDQESGKLHGAADPRGYGMALPA